MATTADIKKGITIEYNNGLYNVIDFLHVKPGKGGAFVRTKLKNLASGNILDVTFNAGASITMARIEKKPYLFLYTQANKYMFMDTDTGYLVEIDASRIKYHELLTEGQTVDIIFHAEEIIGVNLPGTIEVELTEVEASVKGNTVTQAMKKAKTKNGFEIIVPSFIEEGDVIKVDTTNGEYKERVKKKQ